MVITKREIEELLRENIRTMPVEEINILADVLEAMSTEEKKILIQVLTALTNISI